jgi:hypothetical protein
VNWSQYPQTNRLAPTSLIPFATPGASNGTIAVSNFPDAIPAFLPITKSKYWTVTDPQFGGVWDAKPLTGLSITAGSAALQVASAAFTSRDIGKIVGIIGAGVNSNGFAATIAAVSDSTHVILSHEAASTVLPGDVNTWGAYGSDNTLAVSNAMQTCAAGGGGTVFFPEGIYLIGGPVLTNLNSQLIIPQVKTIKPIVIKLKGVYSWNGRYQNHWTDNGSVIFSTSTNVGKLLACGYPGGPLAGWNPTRVDIEGLHFRVMPGTGMSGIDLGHAVTAVLNETWVDVGYQEYQCPQTPFTNTFGIILPVNGNLGGGSLRVSDSLVFGPFETAIQFGEHTKLDNVAVCNCLYAFRPMGGGHTMSMINCNIEGCKYAIKSKTDPCVLVCDSLTIESSFSGWWSPPYLLDDNGALAAKITYQYTTSPVTGLPITNTVSRNRAGVCCRIERLRQYGPPILENAEIFDNLRVTDTATIGGTLTVSNNVTAYVPSGENDVFTALGPDDVTRTLLFFQNRYPGMHNAWEIGPKQTIFNGSFEFANFPEGGSSFRPILILMTNGTVAVSNLAASGTIAAGGMALLTNALSAWPTLAPAPGASVEVNSNGWIYRLCSRPSGTAWTSTNLIAHP